MRIRWRFGVLAGIFLALFSLYPQLNLMYQRGGDWNGHYAYNDIDEVAYAAYLNALIDGRPRKNDPYSGRDDTPISPQPESLFSIQFASPLLIATVARTFGVSTPWAMTLSGALAAFLTSLAVFWIIRRFIGDDWFAMVGSIATLAGGALFAGEGAVGEVFFDGFSYPYFPGFRRYVPAMAIAAFFVFLAAMWHTIERIDERPTDSRRTLIGTTVAILTLVFTVYSYFYIWTTAVSFIVALILIWLAFRPDEFRSDLRRWMIVVAASALASIPYVYMLSKRADTMDDVTLLVKTRALDLTRPPELIGFLIIGVLLLGCAIRFFSIRDKAVLFIAALAVVPAAVFNQQLITGHALQPIHYQVFIGNYVAGLALILTFGLIWRQANVERPRIAKAAAIALAIVAVGWGIVECFYTTRVLDDSNVIRDEAYPVALRLKQLGASDSDVLNSNILAIGTIESGDLPSIAPQPVLWARHQHVFVGLTHQQNRERFFQILHYQNIEPKTLADSMKRGGDFVSMIALFGWGRHTDRLNSDHTPLTHGEIDDAAAEYERYRASFDARRQDMPRLKYLLLRDDDNVDLDQLDKWYERSEPEIHGRYLLYHLTIKAQ